MPTPVRWRGHANVVQAWPRRKTSDAMAPVSGVTQLDSVAQSRLLSDINSRSTYQNSRATDANSASDAATC
jgi:hypothetical protein